MKYCLECGTKLILKELKNEGMIPYCPHCEAYRFEPFSTAVSMIVLSPDLKKTLFIQQYGAGKNWLVAGYINRGETAEEAVCRELKEEVGLEIRKMFFQKTLYWPKSNALLLNFAVIVTSEEVVSNWEIDHYEWVPVEQGIKNVAKGGLAETFFHCFLQHRTDYH